MKMNVVALNLKTYTESSAKNALKLLDACEKSKTNTQIILIPNLLDTTLIALNAKKTKVYVQYTDTVPQGAHTGHIPMQLLLAAGVQGILINHAECRLPFLAIKQRVQQAHALKLETLLCAKDDTEAAQLAKLNPTYIAVEPPELIGTGISVSTAQPALIEKSVVAIRKVNKNVKILMGAGISNSMDYKIALKLGSNGVLLASAFVKAPKPKEWLQELTK